MTLPRERQEARKTSLSCRDRIRGQMPRVATTSLVGQSVDQEVLAKCLNMTSTAEGVEMLQQMEVLQAIGCTEMQSYPFSHARPRAKSDNSSRKIPGGKPEPPDTNTTRRLPAPRKPDGFFCLPGPGPQKIQPASKKNPYRLQGRSGATGYLHGVAFIFAVAPGVLMKDPVTRIAAACLDIGIIVLVFVSLFWKWPPIKAQESSPAAISDLHAHVQQ